MKCSSRVLDSWVLLLLCLNGIEPPVSSDSPVRKCSESPVPDGLLSRVQSGSTNDVSMQLKAVRRYKTPMRGQFVGLPSVRKFHFLLADALRCYCCHLLPRGSRKSCGAKEEAGRDGGDRTRRPISAVI
jgi:hypothetical protein